MLAGTVGGAARLLHVTQPAVTQALAHAELQLGYALFSRQRRKLVPTKEAISLYVEVQQLMAQLESVRRLSLALGSDQAAGLRILIVPSLAVRALPDALRIFRKLHPDVNVSIRVQHSREITQSIALQEADVGVVYGSRSHPAVQEEAIATGRLVCVSKVGAPGADRRSTVALEEVLRTPFIRIDERDPIGTMLAEQWSRLGVAPRANITVQTHHIAMVLAEEGFGPAILDSFTARASRSSLLHVRTVLPEVAVDIKALLPNGLRSSRLVGDFIEAFRAAIDQP
ncbi:MAG: LysR family transcriptional regulator [Hydrogenophaga sp.]|nr:LysR family transcriptional regulator [Hydrogenophaga sp.]